MPTLKIEGVGFNLSSWNLQNMTEEQFIAHAAHQNLWAGLGQDIRVGRLQAAWKAVQEEKLKNPALPPPKAPTIVATAPTITPAKPAEPAGAAAKV